MAVDGIKISELPELAETSIQNAAILGYHDDIPKKNYQIRYTEIKKRIADDIIDPTYNPQSDNAQSGKGVNEALKALETKVDTVTKENTIYIEQVKEELLEITNQKASITQLEETKDELQNQINNKADKTSLQELSDIVDTKANTADVEQLEKEIDEKLDSKVDNSFITDTNNKFSNVTSQLEDHEQRLTQAEDKLKGLDGEFEKVKQEIEEQISNSTVSKEYVDNELAKKLDASEINSLIGTLTDDVQTLYQYHEDQEGKLDTKADKTEIPILEGKISDVQALIPKVDPFVSDYSDNPPSSKAVVSYIESQEFLSQEDVERIKPYNPRSFSTQKGTATKQLYWFTVDKSYFEGNNGYLANVRVRLGTQEEDNQSLITLSVCKWDGSELIPLASSDNYVFISDDDWVAFEYNMVPITGEDHLAFVFSEGLIDEEPISNPEAKLVKVGVICSPSNNGETKIYEGKSPFELSSFIPEIEIDYNTPVLPELSDEQLETISNKVKDDIDDELLLLGSEIQGLKTTTQSLSSTVNDIPNTYATKSELNSHINNSDVHITAAEKENLSSLTDGYDKSFSVKELKDEISAMVKIVVCNTIDELPPANQQKSDTLYVVLKSNS